MSNSPNRQPFDIGDTVYHVVGERVYLRVISSIHGDYVSFGVSEGKFNRLSGFYNNPYGGFEKIIHANEESYNALNLVFPSRYIPKPEDVFGNARFKINSMGFPVIFHTRTSFEVSLPDEILSFTMEYDSGEIKIKGNEGRSFKLTKLNKMEDYLSERLERSSPRYKVFSGLGNSKRIGKGLYEIWVMGSPVCVAWMDDFTTHDKVRVRFNISGDFDLVNREELKAKIFYLKDHLVENFFMGLTLSNYKIEPHDKGVTITNGNKKDYLSYDYSRGLFVMRDLKDKDINDEDIEECVFETPREILEYLGMN